MFQFFCAKRVIWLIPPELKFTWFVRVAGSEGRCFCNGKKKHRCLTRLTGPMTARAVGSVKSRAFGIPRPCCDAFLRVAPCECNIKPIGLPHQSKTSICLAILIIFLRCFQRESENNLSLHAFVPGDVSQRKRTDEQRMGPLALGSERSRSLGVQPKVVARRRVDSRTLRHEPMSGENHSGPGNCLGCDSSIGPL